MKGIDGSYGEGGGQLVRLACALAAITGTDIHLTRVRARRDPPGLAPQHLAAVHAVAELCGAATEGLLLRSQAFEFRPGHLRNGDFRFDVGTAGSITLVLQALLPVATFAPGPVRIEVRGGTDVRAAPPLDYMQTVLLPLLTRIGVHASLEVRQRGYYPRGGGDVVLTVQPGALHGIRLDQPEGIQSMGGTIHVANLPAHILERMERTVRSRLAGFAPLALTLDLLGPDRAVGPGGAVVLWAKTTQGLLGGAEVAQRGVPAEEIASRAIRALKAELDAGSTLDIHASDQLLVYLSLANMPSSFTVREVSSHLRTTAWLMEEFLPVRVVISAEVGRHRVEIVPSPG